MIERSDAEIEASARELYRRLTEQDGWEGNRPSSWDQLTQSERDEGCEHMRAAIAAADEKAWRPITEEIQRRVLVTNNPAGRNARGTPSHVWLVDGVYHDSKRGWTSFDDGNRALWGLVMYCDFPSPPP